MRSYGLIDTKLPWMDDEDDENEAGDDETRATSTSRLNVFRDPSRARQAKIDAYRRAQQLREQLKRGADAADDDEIVSD